MEVCFAVLTTRYLDGRLRFNKEAQPERLGRITKTRGEAAVVALFAYKTSRDISCELCRHRAARDDGWSPHPTRLVHRGRVWRARHEPSFYRRMDGQLRILEWYLSIRRVSAHRRAIRPATHLPHQHLLVLPDVPLALLRESGDTLCRWRCSGDGSAYHPAALCNSHLRHGLQ
jgi:hypothetical protein